MIESVWGKITEIINENFWSITIVGVGVGAAIGLYLYKRYTDGGGEGGGGGTSGDGVGVKKEELERSVKEEELYMRVEYPKEISIKDRPRFREDVDIYNMTGTMDPVLTCIEQRGLSEEEYIIYTEALRDFLSQVGGKHGMGRTAHTTVLWDVSLEVEPQSEEAIRWIREVMSTPDSEIEVWLRYREIIHEIQLGRITIKEADFGGLTEGQRHVCQELVKEKILVEGVLSSPMEEMFFFTDFEECIGGVLLGLRLVWPLIRWAYWWYRIMRG